MANVAGPVIKFWRYKQKVANNNENTGPAADIKISIFGVVSSSGICETPPKKNKEMPLTGIL